MAASKEVLNDIHTAVAAALLEKIKSGEATAADLNVARAFLKDNRIEAIPVSGSPLKSLVDELEADLLRECADQVGLLDHAEVDQDPAERLRGLLVLVQGSVELLGRDQAELDQDLPKLLRLPLDGRHRRSVRSRSVAQRISQWDYLLASSSSLGT